MTQGAALKLTERQRSVMERIDRRVPIKVIAQEMGVSETRINQHIRALKDIYDAGSLNELVAIYRSTQSANPKSVADFGVGAIPTEGSEHAAQFVWSNSQPVGFGPQWVPAHLSRASLDQDFPAPWDQPMDPRAIILARIASILIVGAILLTALLLTYSAGQTVTQAASEGAPASDDGKPSMGVFLT
ncbi:MAG: hypothetical protein ABJ242_05790 [Marinomonas sp.]